MSSEGFKGVPGVPEGWELMEVRHAKPSDWYLGRDGEPQMWTQSCQSNLVYCIIRKIEKPKKYRPFANAAEFKPHRDRWTMHPHEPNKRFKPGDYNDSGLWGNDRRFYSYDELLESGLLFEDGTPFGVEVTE